MRGRGRGGLAALILAAATARADVTPELVVTATRTPSPLQDLVGNTARLDDDAIRLQGHTHITQLMSDAPGAWIARGAEQESLPAIRSPVLTGAGSCGAFLVLEDGIPIRPAGFCNVNEFFDLPTEDAAAIEVVRGPTTALYGANGLHGAVNVLLPSPGAHPGPAVAGEWGPNSYWRARLGWDGAVAGTPLAAGLVVDHDSDFRDSAGYVQGKAFIRADQALRDGTLQWAFSGSLLNQQSAGYITGQDAYRDDALRVQNATPDAYRKADSQRVYARWLPGPGGPLEDADIRFFVRRAAMDFIQNFNPGTPREENGQWSGGVIATDRFRLGPVELTAGVDGELAEGYLRETQYDVALVGGNPAPNRPRGLHYDYDAWSFLVAPYAQALLPLGADWAAQAGLRVEYMRYWYDNRMTDGNGPAPGSPDTCPAAGCLFSRPADRSDAFLNVAPNVGLRYRIVTGLTSYVTLTHGFRPPQATELYRLQSGQSVADLQPETLDSAELGLHWENDWSRAEVAGFLMKKHHFIFQDANRNNVSNGTTRHRGVELSWQLRAENGLYAGFAGTYALHTYAFSQVTPGEVITDGNVVDTAPRTLAGAHAGIDRRPGVLDVEWVHVGRHYINAANTAEYPGHNLLNLRGVWRIVPGWQAAVRLTNVLDKRYAERADIAFGQYRYFPGRDREVYLELAYGR